MKIWGIKFLFFTLFLFGPWKHHSTLHCHTRYDRMTPLCLVWPYWKRTTYNSGMRLDVLANKTVHCLLWPPKIKLAKNALFWKKSLLIGFLKNAFFRGKSVFKNTPISNKQKKRISKKKRFQIIVPNYIV